MSFSKLFIAIGAATMISGCVVIAGTPSRADFHQEKELSLSASELTAMDIDAGAGSLTIKGVEGLNQVTVKADIYTTKNNPENYELTLEKSGSTGFLVAKNHKTSGMWNGSSPRIDVVIEVPEALALTINDGSGEINIQNIAAALSINDGSGNIDVDNIGGDLSIHDGSGSIEAHVIDGTLDIIDGSGSIDINRIKGNVSIEDGSGSIHASDINGNATIDDGSGELTIKQVTGIVTLKDGSGGIEVDTVGGLKILESGSGGLKVNNVEGDFQIDS